MRRIAPTVFSPKPPMKSKDFEIHYNRDFSLKHVENHVHTYYEFYFLISGHVIYSIENRNYSLKPGDILLIAPGQTHFANIDDSTETYERYVLWLRPEYIESISSAFTNLLLPFQKINFSGSHLHLPAEVRHVITNLLQMTLIQANSQEYGADLLINAYITEILIHVSKLKLYQQPIFFEKDFDNNDIVSNTLNYITEHIHENIRIADITEALFISRAHLSRVFSEYMGISVHQYIMKKKMYLVKQDLGSGTSIENICSTYGFGDYSSFFRSFKREFGMSPRAFAKELRQ